MHEHAQAAVAVATEQGFPLYMAQGTSLRGWALAMQGQGEEGLAQIGQGIAIWRATGAAIYVPFLYIASGRLWPSGPPGRRPPGAEAHTLMEQQERRWWEAEISRLRGALLHAHSVEGVLRGAVQAAGRGVSG